MQFPTLDGNPFIDDIISQCWHNEYLRVSDLATHTKALLYENHDADNGVRSRDEGARERRNEITTSTETMPIIGRSIPIGRMIRELWSRLGDWWMVRQRTNEATNTDLGGDTFDDADRGLVGSRSEKEFCQDLEKRGLLDLLSSGEPEHIGFTLEWYRHSELDD